MTTRSEGVRITSGSFITCLSGNAIPHTTKLPGLCFRKLGVMRGNKGSRVPETGYQALLSGLEEWSGRNGRRSLYECQVVCLMGGVYCWLKGTGTVPQAIIGVNTNGRLCNISLYISEQVRLTSFTSRKLKACFLYIRFQATIGVNTNSRLCNISFYT